MCSAPSSAPAARASCGRTPPWPARTRCGKLVAARDWNIGGDRIWIAPEIQYNCTDRTDFWGTLDLPKQMDPGNYTLKQIGDGWTLAQDVTLEAHNLNTGGKTLHVDARLPPRAGPAAQAERRTTSCWTA